MADRIRIADLRAAAEQGDYFIFINADTMLAFIAAVEAADELRLWEPGRRGYAAAQQRVFDALARFDFGQSA